MYQTHIVFRNGMGIVDHTLTAWERLEDSEIKSLRDEHKKNYPDYDIYVYYRQPDKSWGSNPSMILRSIPDSLVK